MIQTVRELRPLDWVRFCNEIKNLLASDYLLKFDGVNCYFSGFLITKILTIGRTLILSGFLQKKLLYGVQ